jgi:hypothetical protein
MDKFSTLTWFCVTRLSTRGVEPSGPEAWRLDEGREEEVVKEEEVSEEEG